MSGTEPLTAMAPAPHPPKTSSTSSRSFVAALGLSEIRWAGFATVLFGFGGAAQLAGAPDAVWWTLYLACYAAGGWGPALAGLQALRAKTLDVDLLMIVAAVVAALIGQVFEGALLIVIFATSGALEAFATRRTEDSVQALLNLAPERAVILTEHGDEEEVDASTLVVGDLVLVRPGERVGADGEILDGVSELDQASITGEPMPVTRGPGDEVFAGTLNGAGAQLLPADKVTAVERLRGEGCRVLLIGDGVNDAPAMAAAHVGVAMDRGGSDLAMETSDVILVRDDLSMLLKTIDLARRSHRVVKANLVIAGTVITTLVAWDIFATLPLPLGVAGHEGSTIIVALNGLRLLSKSSWRRAGASPIHAGSA